MWILLICLAILAILINFLTWKEGQKPWLKDCLECIVYISILLAIYPLVSEWFFAPTAFTKSPARETSVERPMVADARPPVISDNGFVWPVMGRIISSAVEHQRHGLDFDVPTGTTVRAINAGEVIYAGKDRSRGGKTVRIRHNNGFASTYAFNSVLKVKVGDIVSRGQEIAKSGRSRASSITKLHFELVRNDKPVDYEILSSFTLYRDPSLGPPPPVASNVDTSATCGISAGGGCGSMASEVLPPSRVISIYDGPTNFRWPARGRIIQKFENGTDGINIALPEGTPVKAIEDGEVAFAGSELKGYGNMILVRHANGYVSAYAHNNELMVSKGDKVKRGQTIAKSGQTGNVDKPQLHFELRQGSKPVDPTIFLAKL
jgi:murein DD-endopeptidase MepM/ murein hydrolase activator NlpD